MKKTASDNSDMQLRFTPQTMKAIYDHLGQNPAERGGMLGSDKTGLITHYFPDATAECTETQYSPDIDKLNAVIRDWKRQEIRFQGFVHSHPAGFQRLSVADKEYAQDIMSAFKGLSHLALPLVMTEPDSGDYQLIPFVAVRDQADETKLTFQTANIVVSAASDNISAAPRHTSSTSSKKHKVPSAQLPRDIKGRVTYHGHFDKLAKRVFKTLKKEFITVLGSGHEFPCSDADILSAFMRDSKKADNHLQKVQTAYDVSTLNKTRLVIIGVGGAYQLAVDAARAGFGEFVVIDHDTVGESNVGTQSADPRMIGRPKVEALAAEIRRINPRSAVLAIQAKVEDLSDKHFEIICRHPIRLLGGNPEVADSKRCSDMAASKPQKTILLTLTDAFEAQARGNRLSLHFGLPTICAQEYREGRGAEITFTVPGVTPACHRCITASRYRAYLSNGYRNDVTSVGAPIFAGQMLNAALGYILLAVAHHGTSHPRFGKLVSLLGKRNLLLLRMDPDFDSFLGWPAFARPLEGAAAPHSFVMLDTLFLPQGPDKGQTESRPKCPDCGGTGDLRDSKGTFEDTRLMRFVFPAARELRRHRA